MTTDTRQALLGAAERAARTRGYDGFSYADLSRAVGIRKASIHHHFPTKADLSVAVMESYFAQIKAACDDIDRAHITGGARLAACVAMYRRAVNDGDSLCLCVAFSVGPANLPAEVMDQIGAFRAMMMDWLEIVFVKGSGDDTIRGVTLPAQEAAATLSLLEGAQLAARAAGSVDPFDLAVAKLCQRIVGAAQ